MNGKLLLLFLLGGNRCVYRELYEEYKVNSIEQALDNLKKDKGILVHYQFKPTNVSPAFKLYAKSNLYSNRCTYKDKEMIQGDLLPIEWHLDDTFFEIWNEPWSEYSVSSFIYLRCAGMNNKNAKKNWVQASNFCKEYFEK